MSNKIPAITGWLWFKQGFALYRKQPGLLSMLLFLQVLCFMLLNGVPLLGQFIALLLIPSFSMARMQACYLIETGQPVPPSVLVTGFRKDALVPLCKLGVVYLVAVMVLLGITMIALSPDFWEQAKLMGDSKKPPTFAQADVWKALLLALAFNTVMLLLSFAPALTYWKQMPPMKATFYSVFAILGSVRAFAVLILTSFGMFIGILMLTSLIFGPSKIAQSLALFAMFLFALLRRLAIYASYRQLFPDDAPGTAKIVPDETGALG
ncbi:BPSS1780 family membrane protein [Massilia glaciei]|uniref:Uncharacterized protein n=1 Tax=Massilia glaciei TaxID=1524097 RepID=A0A2U2HP38_9BURK|nr:BPSS1780 family membrane protein [Massilia glaciei]PWF49239.1 hypothetical protein C7C56_007795 [Massilia glaciei]